MFAAPGAAPSASAPGKESRFEQFKQSPAFPVLVHTALFAAGVAFIQSSVIEMLSPQL
ncbi:mitochondrial import receptor subunit TOM6 [Kluyveromyces marxianus]|uniref:Mitochondrial import receptor subunit TOM6 n=2 Tax=Kluyveromyces marxianus TaxID=4911 RepID=W0T7Z5_KLUMD|nr:mitochondrial import receptor subunit TOM6 [Kluyveromyces marxianus DMKU3-1042]QGN15249.1 mitochondrial import receptor subunit TOM6 [Kluyveromyces marxianus]BAO39535.1 mitochondrial import receptor subunit TOM6 [Kluyveromyces marxianus DMKU3-1042]